MKDLFNFDRSEVLSTTEKLEVKAMKTEKKQFARMSVRNDNFKNIMREVGGLPNHNEMIAIKTDGTSDCGSIFSYILDEWDVIEDFYVATWTISKANVKRIREALKTGKIKKMTMVFSSTLKAANPALYAHLVGELKPFEFCHLKEINSHAKTFSITNGKDFITVSGSANWSENPRIENYLIINDKPLFEHHAEWMAELANLE